MIQRQSSKQRHPGRRTAWILSLLLFLTPLLSQAQVINSSTTSSTSAVEMPCHQPASTNPQQQHCNHCSDTERSLACDCCETAVSLSLTMKEGVFSPIQLQAERPIVLFAQEAPDPPPCSRYRPPIQHLI